MEDFPEGSTPARLGGLETWLLGRTAAYARRIVADGFARAGSKGYHYRVLASLDEFGPASQAALGRATCIHVSDLVQTVNELVSADLVQRVPDPADRRRNIVTITPEGRQWLERLDRRAQEMQDELLAPLSADERAELRRLLTRLLNHHQGG